MIESERNFLGNAETLITLFKNQEIDNNDKIF